MCDQVDKFALHTLAQHLDGVRASYEAMAYSRIYADSVGLAATTLSAFYLDIIKDTLYADPLNSPARRSVQTVLFQVERARWGRLPGWDQRVC